MVRLNKQIYSWKSEGMPGKSIKNTGSYNTFEPILIDHRPLPLAQFSGSCLRMSSIFVHQKEVNLYISYIIVIWPRDLHADFKLGNCLFRAAELTKNADPDKYAYSGYGIGYNTHSECSLPDGSVGKNVIIFGADMSSSVHIDYKNKGILILGKGPLQGLNSTTLTAEDKYPINFTQSGKRF